MTLEKFKACLILASFGDTFGFRNGHWEFNLGKQNPPLDMSISYIFEFISMGGINNLNLKDWNASDDTILQIAVAKSLLQSDEYLQNCMQEFIKIKNELNTDTRLGGVAIFESITILEKTQDPESIRYLETSGGNGASIRSMAIGLAFTKNKNKLIEYSIEIGRLTHNHVFGYLGSLVTALFVSYGLEGIHPLLWADKLIKLYESGVIDNYMEKKGRDLESYHRNKDTFFNYWRIYIEKFKDRTLTSEINIIEKLKFYVRHFSPQVNTKKGIDYSKIGASGIDSLIIAYDSLLLSIIPKNKSHGIFYTKIADRFNLDRNALNTKLNDTILSWEKLVIYSMLHVGDSDSTGTIAAAWFGAFQGFDQVPNINHQNLEFVKEINELAIKLHKKFV